MMNEKVHIDGYDIYSDELLKKVNIWQDWNDRTKGMIMRINHGKKVKLITNYGQYSKIKYRLKIGYVSNWFIREFKNIGVN